MTYIFHLSAFASSARRAARIRADVAPASRQPSRTFWSHRLSGRGCGWASDAMATPPRDGCDTTPGATHVKAQKRITDGGGYVLAPIAPSSRAHRHGRVLSANKL